MPAPRRPALLTGGRQCNLFRPVHLLPRNQRFRSNMAWKVPEDPAPDRGPH